MKKIYTTIKTYSLFFLLFFILPVFVNAKWGVFGGDDPNVIQNPIEADSLQEFFMAVVDGLIQLGVVISALGIMYGGFLLVTAAGDEEKVSSGRKTLTWAMVGTAVLLGAKVIFTIIEGTVNQLK